VRQLIEKADPDLELTESDIHEVSICLFKRSQHDIIAPRSDRVPFDTHRKNPTTTFRLVPLFKSGADGNRLPSKGHAREADERFARTTTGLLAFPRLRANRVYIVGTSHGDRKKNNVGSATWPLATQRKMRYRVHKSVTPVCHNHRRTPNHRSRGRVLERRGWRGTAAESGAGVALIP
jgi:hypothetical protein